MHDVNRPLPQGLLDPVPMLLLSPAPQFLGEFRWKRSGGEQLTGRFGARTGDDQGAVSLGHQSSVERRKNLFRASGGVQADRRKNIGDVQNGQTHRG